MHEQRGVVRQGAQRVGDTAPQCSPVAAPGAGRGRRRSATRTQPRKAPKPTAGPTHRGGAGHAARAGCDAAPRPAAPRRRPGTTRSTPTRPGGARRQAERAGPPPRPGAQGEHGPDAQRQQRSFGVSHHLGEGRRVRDTRSQAARRASASSPVSRRANTARSATPTKADSVGHHHQRGAEPDARAPTPGRASAAARAGRTATTGGRPRRTRGGRWTRTTLRPNPAGPRGRALATAADGLGLVHEFVGGDERAGHHDARHHPWHHGGANPPRQPPSRCGRPSRRARRARGWRHRRQKRRPGRVGLAGRRVIGGAVARARHAGDTGDGTARMRRSVRPGVAAAIGSA